MNFKKYLQENIVYLDGGMGTLLQANGLKPGELPELWNITHPDVITKIHTDYFNAGSNVVCTNTFGANCLKFSDEELEEIIKCAGQVCDEMCIATLSGEKRVKLYKGKLQIKGKEKDKWVYFAPSTNMITREYELLLHNGIVEG